ncbi:MAG TPA: EAL domain-containing protein [Pseudomonadales bacterium]
MRKPWRRLLAGGAIVILTGLAGLTGLLAPADRLAGDWRTALLAHEVQSDVLIVAIDAQSLRSLNTWPWSRGVHARLLDRLDTADPHAVFLDIDFSLPSEDAAADRALAASVARPRRHTLVLPAFWQYASAASSTGRLLTEPLPVLREHARTGLVNLFPAPDGLVRDAVHVEDFGRREYRSSAAILAGQEGLRPGVAYPIDFRIDPASFEYVSYADVLSGHVPAERIRDRTVLVGATAVELGDTVPVPVHRAVPGVTLQAMLYETLRRGIPHAVPAHFGWLLCLGVVITWWRFERRGGRAQLVFALGTLTLLPVLSLYLHGVHDLLLDVAAPMLAALLCLITGLLVNADRQAWSAMLAALRLRRQQALMSGLFSASIDGILVLDASRRIVDCNDAAAKLFGIDREQLIGYSLDMVLPVLSAEAHAPLRPGRFEVPGLTRGGPVPMEVSVSRVAGDDTGLMTAIVRDVSERHRQHAALRHQATHDPLTGLPNRVLLNELLDTLSADVPAALFMLDLDGFKQVNDTLGHGIGDEVLRALGERLRESLSEELQVFRLGGDEFAVLVSCYRSRAQLLRLADRIIERIREPVTAGGHRLELGGSIGIAIFPEHADNGPALMQCADVAMYTAKSGHHHSAFYDATRDHNTLRNLKMAASLRAAIEEGRLHVVYQPKLRLADRVCCGVEALVRWHDPELGNVSPAEFVPLAEGSDLIAHLTRFTLQQAIRDHAEWAQQGMALDLAVNLSARHLGDAAFMSELVELVADRGIPPERLELEITETALMDDPERVLAVLASVAGQGIRLAMDDFGTGFSSLAYLKHLNLHTLKIDRCFIRDIEHNVSDRKIVESTLLMAHSLDLVVVAEGIENEAQATLLDQLGCEVGQGYAFARPMPADEFVEWYHAHQPSRPQLRSVGA